MSQDTGAAPGPAPVTAARPDGARDTELLRAVETYYEETWFDYRFEDYEVRDYAPQSAISAPVAV